MQLTGVNGHRRLNEALDEGFQPATEVIHWRKDHSMGKQNLICHADLGIFVSSCLDKLVEELGR